MQAALTGHLVMSTLHTNSAAGAVTRLLDMGVENFMLASCLRCVIGQRLVRMLCTVCRQRVEEPLTLPPDILRQGGIEPGQAWPHWRAVGCDRCFNTGFVGRTGIVELLQLDDSIQRLIRPGVTTAEIAAAGLRGGHVPMAVDGLRKCLAGVTTPDEVRRVALEA